MPLCRATHFGNELWVGEAAGEEEARSGKPFVGGAGAWLSSMCRAAKINRASVNIINTIGCRPKDNVFPTDQKWTHTDRATAREAIRYCVEHHLQPVIDKGKWNRIVALGGQAMEALTGRRGILLWRGSPLPLKGKVVDGPKVVPTLHPAYLMRNANLFSVAVRDLKRPLTLPAENYNLYASLEDLESFTATEFAFDFEWDWQGNITLCGLSDRYYRAVVSSFDYPYRNELRRIFENAKVLVGHNIVGADTKHFEKLGWKVRAELVDTMLMHHLVQPDARHGLSFVASVFTPKIFWKGDGEEKEDEDGTIVPTGAQWKTWDSPDAIPREFGGYGGCISGDEAYRLYNARDTDASLQCAGPLKAMLRQFELEKTYRLVSVPVAFICRDLAEQGLKVDNTRLREIRDHLTTEIEKTELVLPDGLKPYTEIVNHIQPAPPNTFKPKTRKCKGSKKNGTQHETIGVVFEKPGIQLCPLCNAGIDSGKMTPLRTIKVPGEELVRPWNSTQKVMEYAKGLQLAERLHSKTGKPTADKNARKFWARTHPEFVTVDHLKKLGTMRNSFAKPGLLNTDRVYFNLLVHGTSEGRLSSSGRREGIDPNIQNQPKAIRKIFIPDHKDWAFLNIDIVQGENMLTAWLAKDWERWERLNTPGFDEHSYMASLFFNKPFSLVAKGGAEEHLRKPGKVINHGRNYGLGERKTLEYLHAEGFTWITLADVREMIAIWRRANWRTAEWQDEVVQLAQQQGYLANAFGRRRIFQTRDFATKALAFLPASTLADMVLRMMIGLYPARFGDECAELGLQVVYDIPAPWRMSIQVHDSLVLQGPAATWEPVAHGVSAVMTQSWPQLDNFKFKVEVEYGTKSWGDCKVVKLDNQERMAA